MALMVNASRRRGWRACWVTVIALALGLAAIPGLESAPGGATSPVQTMSEELARRGMEAGRAAQARRLDCAEGLCGVREQRGQGCGSHPAGVSGDRRARYVICKSAASIRMRSACRDQSHNDCSWQNLTLAISVA